MTNIPLLDGESFEGKPEEIDENVGSIHVNLFSDTSGQLSVYQAFTLPNFDISEGVTFEANAETSYVVKPKGKYFYIKIENNSGEDMTKLDCKTHLKNSPHSVSVDSGYIDIGNPNINQLTFSNSSLLTYITNTNIPISNSKIDALSFTNTDKLNCNITNTVPISNNSLSLMTFTDTNKLDVFIKNSSLDVVVTSIPNITIESMPNVTFTNSTIGVTNSALSNLTFTSSRLLVSPPSLSQASDSVLVFGSDDSGVTKRAIKTSSDGTIAVSSAPTLCNATRLELLTTAYHGIKYTSGYLCGFSCFNRGSFDAYLRFYDRNTLSMVGGFVTPHLTFKISAGQSENINYNFPIAFSSGILIRVSRSLGSTAIGGENNEESTEPLDRSFFINVFYN